MLSYTEENYLKTIFLLSYSITNSNNSDSENNNAHNIHSTKEISTNDIAARIDISAASVTDMLKKLQTKKLVEYEKYRGFKLNATGNKIALNIVRRHRLWEFFLVNKLGFEWDKVHDIAEELEHVSSVELIKRLDSFLSFLKASVNISNEAERIIQPPLQIRTTSCKGISMLNSDEALLSIDNPCA